MHSSGALRSPTDNGKKSPTWSHEVTETLQPLSLPLFSSHTMSLFETENIAGT